MQHPTSLRSKFIRFAMIPAALLCVTVTGCFDEQATGPQVSALTPVGEMPAMTRAATFDRFFVAWSQSHSSDPIDTQQFTLDARQERQFADYADERVLAFARANPGRLYIVGDEPDQYCIAPVDYAIWYHDFVETLRAVDPTARFSPAGFAEPNYKCCPLPDDVQSPCWTLKHSVAYADDFYRAYVNRYGVAPRVHEWRFHNFGLRFGPGDVDGWWDAIQRAATWSNDHGANMVLGTFGFLGWRIPAAEYNEYMKIAMGRILSDQRINGAVYWAREEWAGEHHYLMNPDGSLTAEGQMYANPMTDVPNTLKISGSNGFAKVRWNNTTAAWGSEVEFWVQTPGSDSFVLQKTERVARLGAAQSPFVSLTAGGNVKARVRYYNHYGHAAWSPFSNTIALAPGDPESAQSGSLRKRPVFCFLGLC